jgi:hypothetical protein
MSGIPAWCVRGAKVVCLIGEWVETPCMPNPPAREPMLNEILTIKDVLTTDEFSRLAPRFIFARFAVLLSFEELGHDWLYASHNFAPLVDDEAQERDVAQFRKLLTQNTPELVE